MDAVSLELPLLEAGVESGEAWDVGGNAVNQSGCIWIERIVGRSRVTGLDVADVRLTVSEEEAQRLLLESDEQRWFWRVVERPFDEPQTEIVTA